MSNIIDEIITIDKNARIKRTQAVEKAAEIIKQAEEDIRKIEAEFEEKIENRLFIVKENYTKFADEEIDLIKEREISNISNMENVLSKNGGQWKKAILDRITEGVL